MSLRCERCGGRPWPALPELASNRKVVPEHERQGFDFPLPVPFKKTPDTAEELLPVTLSWLQWADYHRQLGHELALRMREYGGPAEQEEPPSGGTPVAAAMRRAA